MCHKIHPVWISIQQLDPLRSLKSEPPHRRKNRCRDSKRRYDTRATGAEVMINLAMRSINHHETYESKTPLNQPQTPSPRFLIEPCRNRQRKAPAREQGFLGAKVGSIHPKRLGSGCWSWEAETRRSTQQPRGRSSCPHRDSLRRSKTLVTWSGCFRWNQG